MDRPHYIKGIPYENNWHCGGCGYGLGDDDFLSAEEHLIIVTVNNVLHILVQQWEDAKNQSNKEMFRHNRFGEEMWTARYIALSRAIHTVLDRYEIKNFSYLSWGNAGGSSTEIR